MDSIEGKEYFEVVTNDGKLVTNHFINRKSLDSYLKINLKNDPHFHEKHYIAMYRVKWDGNDIIQPLEPTDEELQLEMQRLEEESNVEEKIVHGRNCDCGSKISCEDAEEYEKHGTIRGRKVNDRV